MRLKEKIKYFLSVIAIISSVLLISNMGFFSDLVRKSGTSSKNMADAVLDRPENIPYYGDLVIQEMHLDGDDSSYSMRRGDFFRNGIGPVPVSDTEKTDRLLRLAFFHQWTNEDPLMSSLTIDADRVGQVVATLKEEQDGFLGLYEKKNSIFPFDFLDMFIEASMAHVEFTKDISERNAKKLLEKMENANDAYFKDAESFYNIISDLKRNELNDKKLAFLAGDTYTDSRIVLDDIDKIKNNSLKIGVEINKRKKCLLESSIHCKRLFAGIPKPRLSEKEESGPNILSDRILNLEDGIDYFGPYEVNSWCWNGVSDRQYLYAAVDCRGLPGSCIGLSQLATNTYYEMVELSKMPFEKYMKEQGVLLIPQQATNPYECMNLEYQPKLATVDYFVREYKDRRFFEEVKKGEVFRSLSEGSKRVIEAGVEAERSFFDSKYPSENKLEFLGNYYAHALSYFSDKDVEIERYKLRERYLVIREKLVNVDLVMNRIKHIFSGFRKKADRVAPPSLAYVHFVRSNYSIFFLNFSSAVWRSGEKLRYMNRGYAEHADKDGLLSVYVIDYEDAVNKYGEEKIQKWTNIYNTNKEKRLGDYNWTND